MDVKDFDKRKINVLKAAIKDVINIIDLIKSNDFLFILGHITNKKSLNQN